MYKLAKYGKNEGVRNSKKDLIYEKIYGIITQLNKSKKWGNNYGRCLYGGRFEKWNNFWIG